MNDDDTIWFRRCATPDEAAAADREFWLRMSPEERVALVEQMREEWLKVTGEKDEGLRRVARVIQRPRR
jgi:hypothetical protein